MKLRVISIATFLAATASAAQAEDAEQRAKDTGGALLFQVGGITGTPGAMDGIGVGGLYFVAPRMALRGALGLLNSSQERDPGGDAPKSEQSSFNVSLEGGLEYLVVHGRTVNIWAGGLLQVGKGTDEVKDVNETDTLTFALAGALGADWFFAESVSLGAEYRLGLQSVSKEDKPEGGTKSTTSTTVIGVGSAGLRLGFWW